MIIILGSNRINFSFLLALASVVVVVNLSAFSSEAQAIPAFARRYQTSCTSCHIIIPKLNHFGKAFKANGYRIPPSDKAFTRVPDIKLGDEEWKELWPKGIWPGAIPGFPPIALRIDGDFLVNPGARISSDFAIPREIEILAGGNAGDGFSYFLELAFERDEVVLERAFGQFDQIGGSALLNLKVGRYEIAAVPFSRFSRRLTASDFLTSSFRAVSGGFSFKDRQQGIELWGARSVGRGSAFRYGIGVVNGSGSHPDTNSAKDVYFRLAYQLHGLGVSGSEATPSRTLKQTNNWRDDSFQLGVFGYFGKSAFADVDDRFRRLGFDLDFWYQSLNVFGLIMRGSEWRDSPGNFDFTSYFIEADYVLLPWLIAVLRYEAVKRPEKDINRVVPAVIVAYRANVRLIGEAELYADDSGDSLARIRLDFLF